MIFDSTGQHSTKCIHLHDYKMLGSSCHWDMSLNTKHIEKEIKTCGKGACNAARLKDELVKCRVHRTKFVGLIKRLRK